MTWILLRFPNSAGTGPLNLFLLKFLKNTNNVEEKIEQMAVAKKITQNENPEIIADENNHIHHQ